MGPKQMRAILMRLDGRSNRQVASALGMSVHSINAWWKRPDMKREYVFQRARLVAAKRGATESGEKTTPVDDIVEANASLAAQTLVSTLMDTGARDETRMRAAERLLEMGGFGKKPVADAGLQVVLSDDAVAALCRCAEECTRIRARGGRA